MAKKSPKPGDFAEVARAVVDQATAERPEPVVLEVKREQMVGHFEARPIGQPAAASST